MKTQQNIKSKGFALIATISVLSLMVMIAIGMLSLSAVTVRTSAREIPMHEAKANARMALMIALGELQETAGLDQRITADGSILGQASGGSSGSAVSSPYALGVWESWSARLGKNTKTATTPDYDAPKESGFLRWLISGDEEQLKDRDWVLNGGSGDLVTLFKDEEGIELNGELVTYSNAGGEGAYAWAITQEGTKAKINIAGPELEDREPNDDLQVQPRANLEFSEYFSNPTELWNHRASRVIDLRQAMLDDELAATGDSKNGSGHFTTSSYGLLTNVVDGGLKVDLSLGFEMDDADFSQASWGSIKNPFVAASENEFTTPSSYGSQRPLYEPLNDVGYHNFEREWDLANVHFHFPVTSVPTFDTLRSHYRIAHHLYETADGVTVFERGLDHVAAREGELAAGFERPPHFEVVADQTQTGVRPVLDRVMFLVSLALTEDDKPSFAFTPVITLWNPYNVALEIEGAVAYPWLDLPWQVIINSSKGGAEWSTPMANVAGSSRQINPYFIAAITPGGGPIMGAQESIRFKPGEVRVFCPASPDLKTLDFTGMDHDQIDAYPPRDKTIFMKPVDNMADYNISGGFVIQPHRNGGARSTPLESGDTASMTFRTLVYKESLGIHLPFMIGLSDATLAKGADPAVGTRGQVIANVLTNYYNKSRETYVSPTVSFESLKQAPLPVASIEVFHRVANSSENGVQSSDLVFSGNPRQSSMNPYVTHTEFENGPQYELRMREVSSANGLINTSGEVPLAAYYGASQSPFEGRTHLSFFELPKSPLISMADFQHADLTCTPFSPANQFGNSWASAYVERGQVVDDARDGLEVDHSYLVNEALWDGYFFSSLAPEIEPGTGGGNESVWDTPVAQEVRSLESVLSEYVDDPRANPLRNGRMRLLKDTFGGLSESEFVQSMLEPEACVKSAGHLMVDGAFNVNSTSVKAWTAVLLGLRGASFELGGVPEDSEVVESGSETPFPRFSAPVGSGDDVWHGFRSLTDDQVEELAEKIVEEVQLRGPFLSLSEFINRRVEDSDEGLSGAIQAAIDKTAINEESVQVPIDSSLYESEDQANIDDAGAHTGTGIPGYLTQADVLKSLAPVITVRSDSFVIRSYGEARGSNGEVAARVWIEATVQRYPDYMDSTNAASDPVADLTEINRQFGRVFRITSFRYLNDNEALALAQ
ncbi:hypothetical protein ACFPK9_12425 [Rubritalea spongiae]|uniref:Verru_Chthon cassette protein A n=1 Tax=Rubritalea spongiae TaxID=430797 RepID=A0ABW5E5Q3_9BACT